MIMYKSFQLIALVLEHMGILVLDQLEQAQEVVMVLDMDHLLLVAHKV